MNGRRMIIGTIVGAVVLYATGYLIFTVIFREFYAANLGIVPNASRTQQIEWVMFAASIPYALLICLALSGRNGSSLQTGAGIGGIVGMLLWLTADLVHYGSMNTMTATLALVDPLLEFVHGAIGGAAIALATASRVRAGAAAATASS